MRWRGDFILVLIVGDGWPWCVSWCFEGLGLEMDG